jgi:hypothetical protein
MILEEYFNYRQELLDQSKDDEGFIQQSLLLSELLPSLLDAKLIDSEDHTNSYFFSSSDKMKVNAYCVNESGERLQLFIIDESSIDLLAKNEDLQISKKSHYDTQFKRATKFINKALKKHLNEEIQDSSPARALISKISSSEGVDQFDVVEIFLISTTSTVSIYGTKPEPKKFDFENEEIIANYTKDREKRTKKILIKKRLIDLNFLYNVLISQGNRESLQVDFQSMFGSSIQAIKAADEEKFESYLCVLPADIISGLYKEYSSRLLEKNVRSFLQFRGVNQGIRETIRKEPEKFVAYNNGLTITATGAEIVNESGLLKIKSLTDFQIVNGGQTTATIYFTQKDGYDISQVKVMAKINVAKQTTEDELEELISNISTYSNAQSRVSKVDLRSRNPQLVKIKSLTESVLTPAGDKWFFERAKGEYNTKLRIAGSNKNRLRKEYPNERRFSKEQLAKYYSAWGDKPYMVKKGGEKVFRYFIEEISGEGTIKKIIDINRTFYEELIAKIIIFRKLEKLYGQGKNSMGQLRSAVVPYSMSVLYKYTDGNKKGQPLDLLKIWINEDLDDDLETFFNNLLLLINDLIKKYSKSDDLGEYSKKEELWKSIINSSEVIGYMSRDNAYQILEKYTITKEEQKRRSQGKLNKIEVDFKHISDNVLINVNGVDFYKKIASSLNGKMTSINERLIAKIIHSINKREDLNESSVKEEKTFIENLRNLDPQIFDEIQYEPSFLVKETLNYIIYQYNKVVDQGGDLESEFDKIGKVFAAKNHKYTSVFLEIGKQLANGVAPNVHQIYYASNSLQDAYQANNLV